MPLPRNRYLSAEGIGYDHSRSSASGILGIGSTPPWGIPKRAQAHVQIPARYDAYEEMLDQVTRSEHMRCVIERHIAKWERKYPARVRMRLAIGYMLGAPTLLEYAVESGTTLPAGNEFWDSVLDKHFPTIDVIDAHIARVTGQQHVPEDWGSVQHTNTTASTWGQGPVHGSSLLPPVLRMGSRHIGDHGASPDDPVIPFVSEPLYMCANMFIDDRFHLARITGIRPSAVVNQTIMAP